jgi:hypothetical protein
VRDSLERVEDKDERCWVRKVESVLRESEMRRRALWSGWDLKLAVHWAMSCGASVYHRLAICVLRTYSRGIFVEKHFDDERVIL